MEIWKTIWFNPLYEVSTKGRVRNKKSGKILATNPTKSHKTPQVWLYTHYFGTTLQYSLAKIVYYTFNLSPFKRLIDYNKRISYRDGNKMNCKLNNLYIKET